MADATDVPAPVKPGWKTTEFWGSVAVIVLSIVVASGAVPATGPWSQAIALASAALTAMGYSASRATTKANP